MGETSSSTSIRQLPRVALATFAVVGAPLLVVLLLRLWGVFDTGLAPILTAVGLSVAASYAGSAIWAARAGSGETVFGDLMIWGWLRRRRQERQLASAVSLLGLDGEGKGGTAAELGRRRRVRLLKRLAGALEARSPDTHGHSRRVAYHAAVIAKRMGLPREEVARIRAAAAVHDVGKIEMPAEIVDKPGPLSDDEFAVVKEHPETGARMVAGLGDDELTRIVRHHHERVDGSGYPDGLAGEEIPLGARIVAAADTFDAVTSPRPYREARTHKAALSLLGEVSGTQLDRGAVHAFRSYYSAVRPAAVWSFFLNSPRQLLVSLGGQAKLAGSVTAATLATATAGGVAMEQASQAAPAASIAPPAATSTALPAPQDGGSGAPVGRGRASAAAGGVGAGGITPAGARGSVGDAVSSVPVGTPASGDGNSGEGAEGGGASGGNGSSARQAGGSGGRGNGGERGNGKAKGGSSEPPGLGRADGRGIGKPQEPGVSNPAVPSVEKPESRAPGPPPDVSPPGLEAAASKAKKKLRGSAEK